MFQPDLAIQTVKNALSSLSLADGPPLDYPEGPIAYALGLSLDGNAPVAPLAEALQEGNLAIEELDHAQVPTLKVNNIGPEPVYVALGAALCGGKQNRMVSIPIVIGAHTETELSVNCVERGRWSPHSQRRFDRVSITPASLKSGKMSREWTARRHGAQRSQDQGEVWRDVSERLDTRAVHSRTEDLLESVGPQSADIGWRKAVREHWANAAGIVVLHRGRVVGLDAWSAERVRHHELENTVSSYALDFGDPSAEASDTTSARPEVDLAAFREPSQWQVRQSGEAALVDFALGPDLTGSAVVLQDTLVHLTVIPAQAA